MDVTPRSPSGNPNPYFSSVTLAPNGMLYESFAYGIVASTTRTQAAATQLTAMDNRVDTSTAAAAGSTLGDGVALPVGAAGLDVVVVNNTANPIQVYPAVADTGATINGIAATVGVPLPPGDVASFECMAAGDWRFEPGFGAAGPLPTVLSAESISAVTPAAQSTATVLAALINHITTVSAAGAAVALPPAKMGLEIAVENSTANPLTVYPVNGGSDTINGQSANTPAVIPPYTSAIFRAASGGTWQSDPFFNAAGLLPSSGAVQLGSAATGGARSGGNASVQVVAAGQGNAAATTDTVLATFALPASAFDVAGRQVTITAAGSFAANGNNKRVKIWWGTTTQTVGAAVVGGTLIADSGVITTNNGGWSANVLVTKYGAAGSNTQIATGAQVAAGSSHLGTAAPTLLTATESGVINITVTGASTTTGAANDVLGTLFDVAFNN